MCNVHKIPRLGLVSARSSWPLSNLVGEHHDVWLRAILARSQGNQQQQRKRATADNVHSQMPVPAVLMDSFMGKTQRSKTQSACNVCKIPRTELVSAKSMTAILVKRRQKGGVFKDLVWMESTTCSPTSHLTQAQASMSASCSSSQKKERADANVDLS
jgi:hypothetical protein